MSADKEYFDYLRSRTFKSQLYRRNWVFPRICRYLSDRVLDIGCGIGDFIAYRRNTVGLDINPHCVEWCRQKGYDAFVIKQERFPFDDQTFMGALLDNVIEHVMEPEQLLGETRRVLADKGCLVVGVPGRKGYVSDDDHKIFYDLPLLSATLLRAGFQVRHAFFTPFRSNVMDMHLRQYCTYVVSNKR